ncbi:MAG: helix-turn-helix domain-containing protein [Lachnospiraceae bacterium]|nr:helix-turn-helix domain-containing protein [Lachnospiraceae bacterium]
MKRSDSLKIFELLKEAGISHTPDTLTSEELEKLQKNSELKNKILSLLHRDGQNFYQELEMDSPYVNTHRDVSYIPELLQLHSHSFYEIIYCETGNIQYLIEDKRYRIRGGDIILVPPGISHRPIFPEETTTPYSRIVLWISTAFFQTIASVCPDLLLQKLKQQEHFLLRTEGTSYKYLGRLFKQGVQEASEMAPLWDVSLYGNTTSLLAHLGRAFMSEKTIVPIEKKEEIDKIISYIEINYAMKITLEDTARKFHISTSTLSKLFLSKLGISFYQFVTQRRLIHSKLKIEEGSSMEETALDCGFCDYSAFYRAFKKEYGISPREYRKMVISVPSGR